MKLPDTTIIGTGGLGKALGRVLYDADIPVKSIFNRSEHKARNLAEELNVEIAASFPSSGAELGDLVFITVNDQAIEAVADRLAKLENDFPGCTVVHCSGSEAAEILAPVQEKGAAIASLHPLQTFTDDARADIFRGIYFSLQGDQESFPLLQHIVGRLGAKTLKINKDQKAHLHAAAVIASNYLNSLLNASVETAELSDLPGKQVKKALMPLIKTGLENIENSSFQESLTGPIKRGDIETVEKHRKLLNEHSELLDIYCSLGRHTVRLSEGSGYIDESIARELRNILS